MPPLADAIVDFKRLITPSALLADLPLSAAALQTIFEARKTTTRIIKGEDSRLLVIVGPCSIHDPNAAREYAERLQALANQLADELFIVMRVYFEKPRTQGGWRGFISDPLLNGSFNMNDGLKLARQLLLDITHIGLPTATEFLDTIIPSYLSDLITWSVMGARTSESQIHRELASSFAMPLGFKNSTDGNIKIAIDAVKVARHPHHFVGISNKGEPCIIATKGNNACHIILRGSQTAPNFQAESIQAAAKLLQEANLSPRLMVDCSHGNSQKMHERQSDVVNTLLPQLADNIICGIMLESHLVAGNQILSPDRPLIYGQSITDSCIGWEETVLLLEKLATAVRHKSFRL